MRCCANELTPDSDMSKPASLSMYGAALQARFENLGAVDDLEVGISAHRRAVELAPDDAPVKPVLLSNLAGSLFRRFERLGKSDDIKQPSNYIVVSSTCRVVQILTSQLVTTTLVLHCLPASATLTASKTWRMLRMPFDVQWVLCLTTIH